MGENLTEQELELLEIYDSRYFGFLILTEPVCDNLDVTHKTLLTKGLRYYENALLNDGTRTIPNTYCKLGHFHLLLEDYVKALSAYQKFFSVQGDYWKDAPFLYGLGIVYFHYGAYMWTIKAFQQVLYLDPGFTRSNEIHLKLGMMFKMQGNYESSMKHFHQALLDSHPCSLSKFEIQFHIGHLYEMQNKCQDAQETYEAVIQNPDITNDVKSNVYKQLGWMYYTKEQLGEKTARLQTAVQYLQKAIESDNASGVSWYLLGRCYAVQGKVHDAFIAYRHAIDKSDASADTWCSIGVLYQQQNQPMDALQAYICAVQLDPYHAASWTDLGILYEACGQPLDAVKCYNAAKRCGASSPALDARIKLIQAQADLTPNMNGQTKSLPLIEEAWKMPIPAELTSRTLKNAKQTKDSQPFEPLLQQPASQNPQQPSPPPAAQPPHHHHSQVVQTSQASSPFVHPASTVPKGNGIPSLTTVSNSTLPVISSVPQSHTPYTAQSKHASIVNHQTSTSHQHNTSFQNAQQMLSGYPQTVHSTPSSHPQNVSTGFYPSLQNLTCDPTSTTSSPTTIACSSTTPHSRTTSSQPRSVLGMPSSGAPSPAVGILSSSTIPASLVNFQIDPQTGMPLSIINSQSYAMLKSNSIVANSSSAQSGTSENFESLSNLSGMLLTSRDPVLSAVPLISESSTATPQSQPLTVNVLSSSSLSLSSPPLLSPPIMSPGLSSPSRQYSMLSPSEMRKSSQQGSGLSALGSLKVSLLLEPGSLPQPPDPPSPPCTVEKLSPTTPSLCVSSKADAYSPELQNLCQSPSQPITVIRGLDEALGIDLSLFSTKALLNAHADHEVEVRTQKFQTADENVDEEGRKVWLCESSRSYSTIAKYAQYQATTFTEAREEEVERSLSDSDSSSSSISKKKKRGGPRKIIKFGTNCDLSDEKKWKAQFLELNKLPPFLRVFSTGNILSHVDHVILGMNSVQLYMKIPGCRTPGHQENLNFSSVNINIGPGDCEWFAVPLEYWGTIHNFCEKNNVDFLMGSWWPVLEDLYEERVPVYRFIQKPGDLVWVNAGSVHWVQALGWCNNVAWNVGPFTEFQYNMAVERYEWNKLQGNRSIVPMILLSWNLARNVKITEKKLYEHIRQVLERVLQYCQVTLDCLKETGVTVTLQRRGDREAAYYCCVCEIEVFNILFVTSNKKHQVHCQDCARKANELLQGFVVLHQFPMNELWKTYNDFRLYQQSTAQLPAVKHHP